MNKIAVSLLLFFLLSGCVGDDFDDLKVWMDDSSRGLKPTIEPLPAPKPYEPFVYSAFELVDPFNKSKMEVAKRTGGALAPNLNRPRETLELYDLEKLRMVARCKGARKLMP